MMIKTSGEINMVKCKSGRHEWLFEEDAQKCCNGYRRVLVIGNIKECNTVGREKLPGGFRYGYKWTPI
jgi:hypothetical protein